MHKLLLHFSIPTFRDQIFKIFYSRHSYKKYLLLIPLNHKLQTINYKHFNEDSVALKQQAFAPCDKPYVQ